MALQHVEKIIFFKIFKSRAETFFQYFSEGLPERNPGLKNLQQNVFGIFFKGRYILQAMLHWVICNLERL